MTTPSALPFTGDDDADRLLAEEPLALLIGFALDLQADAVGPPVRVGGEGPPEPIGQGSRGASAGLGQEEAEPEAGDAHGAVRLAGLGADDVGQRPGDSIDGLVVRVPPQLDQQDGRGTAVASLARALVLERDGPVLAGVELERATGAFDGAGLASWRGGAVEERLDMFGRPFVLVVFGQDEALRAARPWQGRAGGGTGGCGGSGGVEGFLHAPAV